MKPRAVVGTLEDLRTGSFPGTPLAVLGSPIGHSLSPRMHNGALAQLAGRDPRFASWHYRAFEIAPPQLAEALELLHRRGFLGVNLTVPHKIMALDLVADVDPEARRAGAVNTLRRERAGWSGFNTDGYGLAAAVREAFDADLAGRDIVLLGAGGAARAAGVQCLAAACRSIAVGNRTRTRREELLALLQPFASRARLTGFDPSAPEEPPLPAGGLVINATSVGLKAGDPAVIDLARIPRPAAVFDMIYNPPETALLHAARRLGVPAANGLGMLVHQGAKSLELWSGIPADRAAPLMFAALQPLTVAP